MKVNGVAVACTGAGALLMYSGIRGLSITAVLRDIVQGKKFSGDTANQWVFAGSSGGSTSPAAGTGSANGPAIAALAQTFSGHKYVFGGPSNPASGWDCSSFVAYILGRFGIGIPGGTWASVTNNGASHGPVAAAYLIWSGAKTIPRSQVQPGDLLCWETHIGFVASDGKSMISAYDTQSGTLITPIDGAGPTAEVLVCRRLVGV